jgi:predicted  nucleic acid-binding Zn-ribbon protein
MNLETEIKRITEHLERAQTASDAGRAAGMQDRYLSAYVMVEALELQLSKLRKEQQALNEKKTSLVAGHEDTP